MTDICGHVLVVDDNALNRKMPARAVERQGCRATTAEDGRQALALLTAADAGPFVVILLDILMPTLDGYQVLAQVKRDARLRHIPVIMISALDEMESVVRCIEMGATDYLPKPFNPALLRARPNASLVEKRLRDLELEYLEQVNHVVSAAQAVEAAKFDPASLDQIAVRGDALGGLARVFQRMAREVYLRERRPRQQLEQLRLDMEEMKRAQSEPLAAYLPMDRCHALATGATLPDRTTGAALFADISGFTPLTGALAQELGRERGAAELTRTVSQIYTALIDEVHRYGGSVIGFAGDAITCWFDDATTPLHALKMSAEHPEQSRGRNPGAVEGSGADVGMGATLRAVACGLAMQEAMALCNAVTTPGGATFDLAVKIAVVAGPVRRFLIGAPEIQLIEAIAGQTLDRLAAAEHAANRGEVIVQGEVAEPLAGQLTIRERRTDERGRPLAVVTGPVAGVAPTPWPELSSDALSDAGCRPWVLSDVYERVRSGHKQYLSEPRPVAALFINFKGIDYDADVAAGAKLDTYIRWVQHIADRHEAIFDHLTMGDKGSYICLAFGAPIAHSDDETRAVYAALQLLSPPSELAFVGAIRIGVAAGQALVGTYGGRGRRTYGVQGERVNLAARLMIAAPEGDILCDDEVYRAAQGQVAFTALPPIRVKGFAEPVSVYRPTPHLLAPIPDARPGQAGGRWDARSRLDHLSPSEQLLLKVASVLGPTFTIEALAEIVPVDSELAHLVEHLRQLEAAGLLVGGTSTGTYAFADGSLHNAAYTAMLFVQRRTLHRRVAEWYEQTYRADLAPHTAILAHHWRQGDEPAKAIEYLERAGRQAQARGALEEAEHFFRESLALDAQAAVLSAAYYGDGVEHAGPDYEAAIRYAVGRLERELAPELTYHNLWHTVEDVLPAVRRLAALCGVDGEDACLLEVAAAFHDIGYVVQRHEHERASAEIAAQVLPGFGFTSTQVAAVQGMILATRLPQSPRTPLDEILADADLDNLGRDDALARSLALRTELAALGTAVPEAEWYRRQWRFLREHRYFTSAARNQRDQGKQKNIEALEPLLANQGVVFRPCQPDADMEACR